MRKPLSVCIVFSGSCELHDKGWGVTESAEIRAKDYVGHVDRYTG